MNECLQIEKELISAADRKKAVFLMNYFKAVPGGYGEGDSFIGVRVPEQRRIARKYQGNIPLTAIETFMQHPVHEYRLTGLFMLVYRYEKAETEIEQEHLISLYLKNLPWVNNWDLVDASADKLLGAYLMERPRDILYKLAKSDELWQQRIAIVATLYFIKRGDHTDTLVLAKRYLHHSHDLIHKATGWMLREVGKKFPDILTTFLQDNYPKMPRTMLRYAIERFDPEQRKKMLRGEFAHV